MEPNPELDCEEQIEIIVETGDYKRPQSDQK